MLLILVIGVAPTSFTLLASDMDVLRKPYVSIDRLDRAVAPADDTNSY
jgi:hypothetical protein